MRLYLYISIPLFLISCALPSRILQQNTGLSKIQISLQHRRISQKKHLTDSLRFNLVQREQAGVLMFEMIDYKSNQILPEESLRLLPEDANDPFIPFAVIYEKFSLGRWTNLHIGYCGASGEFHLKAGKYVKFPVDSLPFESTPKGTLVRIKIRKLASKAFIW